jgi:hypothetical protein
MRRRIRTPDAIDHDLINAFVMAVDDEMTETWFGPDVFATTEEARQAWPRCRRAVWAATDRMRIPTPARVFDGLRFDSPDAIRSAFHCVTVPAAEMLATVAGDRAALEAFCRREPRAARDIAGYLDVLRADLDLIERQVREMPQASSARRYPGHDWKGGTYGGRDSGEAA